MLSVVATPIGNLKDITLRAIEVLRETDFVIAENPGHTRKLLDFINSISVIPASPSVIPAKAGIQSLNFQNMDSGPPAQSLVESGMTEKGERVKKELMQFAEYNEQRVLGKIIERLKRENGALVTDAGTPGISDPGFRLVRACWDNDIAVDSLPGPNAAITALAASGLPTDKYLFVGFLPKTEPKLIKIFEQAKSVESTLVAYESPQRIIKTLEILAKDSPSATVFVGRELTKLHQTYYRGTPQILSNKFHKLVKGEITLCVSFK